MLKQEITRFEAKETIMEKSELYRHIDHTLLKAYASWQEIARLCDEAVLHQTASVCIPPCYIRRVKEAEAALPSAGHGNGGAAGDPSGGRRGYESATAISLPGRCQRRPRLVR